MTLGTSFDLWSQRVDEARKGKEVARNIVKRWQQQTLDMALNNWAEYLSQSTRLQDEWAMLEGRLSAADRKHQREKLAKEWAAEKSCRPVEPSAASTATVAPGVDGIGARAAGPGHLSAHYMAVAGAQDHFPTRETFSLGSRDRRDAPSQGEMAEEQGSARRKEEGSSRDFHGVSKVAYERVTRGGSPALVLGNHRFWIDGTVDEVGLDAEPTGQIYHSRHQTHAIPHLPATVGQGESVVRNGAKQAQSNNPAKAEGTRISATLGFLQRSSSKSQSSARKMEKGKIGVQGHSEHLGHLSTEKKGALISNVSSRPTSNASSLLSVEEHKANGNQAEACQNFGKATSPRSKEEGKIKDAMANERQEERGLVAGKEPRAVGLQVPTTLSTESRVILPEVEVARGVAVSSHHRTSPSIPSSYTGPTSPLVDRKLLHTWTRSGDGDPRSESFYLCESQYSNNRAQMSPSETECGSPESARRKRGQIDSELLSDGLQSEGLQSSAHVSRGQEHPPAGIQVVYNDLDEANRIIERVSNRHMLPRSVAERGRVQQRMVDLHLEHAQGRRQPLVLGISQLRLSDDDRTESYARVDAPGSPRIRWRQGSRAHTAAVQLKQYLMTLAGGCVGWFVGADSDCDGFLAGQDMLDDLRRLPCDLSHQDALALVDSLCDPHPPHLIRLSEVWTALHCPHLGGHDTTGVAGGVGNSKYVTHDARSGDLALMWDTWEAEAGLQQRGDTHMYSRLLPDMTRKEFERETLNVCKRVATRLQDILSRQEELELRVRLEAQLLQQEDDEIFNEELQARIDRAVAAAGGPSLDGRSRSLSPTAYLELDTRPYTPDPVLGP